MSGADTSAVSGRAAAKVRLRDPYLAYRIVLGLYAAAFLVFLYAPLVMIAFLSFNDSPIIGFPFQGFSFKWYAKVLNTPVLLQSFGNSVMVGFLSATIATVLALLLALGFRHAIRYKPGLLNLILVPIIIPGIVGGIVLLIFFGYIGVRSSLWTTVLVAHINWVLPFAFLTLYPRLHRFDRALEEAATDLGARPLGVFRYIVWPLVRPAVIATVLFAFSLSFDEFIRTIFVVGYDRTIPVQFWSMIVDDLAPELPAMAVMIIFVSAFTSFIAFLVGRRAG